MNPETFSACIYYVYNHTKPYRDVSCVPINCAALGHCVKHKCFIIYTILGHVSRNWNNAYLLPKVILPESSSSMALNRRLTLSSPTPIAVLKMHISSLSMIAPSSSASNIWRHHRNHQTLRAEHHQNTWHDLLIWPGRPAWWCPVFLQADTPQRRRSQTPGRPSSGLHSAQRETSRTYTI